jgi:hypothetical protein
MILVSLNKNVLKDIILNELNKLFKKIYTSKAFFHSVVT